MIEIENTHIYGLEDAVRGMRNPFNSWEASDSGICKGGDNGIKCDNCCYKFDCDHCFDYEYKIGIKDHYLMQRLSSQGSCHAKFRRMIIVSMDITAPLYWWKEFDTYKVGTVSNSCSTMHMIHAKPFEIEDFSSEHLYLSSVEVLKCLVGILNSARENYISSKSKEDWWQLIQLLPSSYNQRRTIMLNYEVLSNIYANRKNHKLDEWRILCEWIKELPYSDLMLASEE